MKLYDTISVATISIAVMEQRITVRNFNPYDIRDEDAYERLKRGVALVHLRCRPGYCVEKNLFFAEMGGVGIVGFINVLPELGIGRVVLEYGIDRKYSVGLIIGELVDAALRCADKLGAGVAHVSLSSTAAKEAEVLSSLGFREVRRYHELRLEKASLVAIGEPDLEFLRLKSGEEAKLAEVENCCFEGTWGFNPNTAEYVAWEMKVKGNCPEDIILLLKDGEVIGYCWSVSSSGRDSFTDKSKGRIYMLGVRPSQRGRGLGRKLLLAGLWHLRDKGDEIVDITVDSQNTVAVELYRSLGFHVVEDTLWYEKIID